MKKIYSIILTLATALTITGCLGKPDKTGFTPETPVISFSEESISVEKGGGEVTIAVNSNLPWRIKSNSTWVTLSESNGLESADVTVKISRNRMREERTAVLTAWITEESTATISIIQAPAEASESVTFHVKADGNGLASGDSWENATTLPTAIEAAGDGDVILLAAGTYTPATLITGGDGPEERTFEIHSNFTLEGGYPADATTGAVAAPANETILSGNSSAYHVVTVSAVKNQTHKVILKNLTIQDGKGHSANKQIYRYSGDSEFDAGEGAGLCIGVSNVEVTNCRITGNTGAYAAGCIVAYEADVVFRNCTISDNVATGNGGGLWNEGDIEMYDCSISNNRASLACAGYYGVGGNVTAYNCSFTGNDNAKGGKLGGGAYLREGNKKSSESVFVNCTFADNKSGSGGGVAIYGTSSETQAAHVTFISCTITGNTASKGGGLWVNNATPKANLYNTIISGNNTEIEFGGTVQATESQVSKHTVILGSSLLNKEGTAVSGWSFNPETMLGALDCYNGSTTKSFPLIALDTNPAIDQGMSSSELEELAGNLSIDAALIVKDQNGHDRTKKAIGSYVLNN